MTIEDALTAKLEAVLGHTRVYPDGGIPEQNEAWPCVTYDHQGDDDQISLGGTRTRVRVDEFTLEVIGPLRGAVAATRDTLKAAFCGYNARGLWGGASGVYVTGAVARDAQADADDPFDGGEDLNRRERLSLRINHKGA